MNSVWICTAQSRRSARQTGTRYGAARCVSHSTRGRAGKGATDAYVTNLAQTRGFEAQKLGSDFCLRNPGLFDEVMALPNADVLPAYAAGKDLIPDNLGSCEVQRAAPVRHAAASSRKRGK